MPTDIQCDPAYYFLRTINEFGEHCDHIKGEFHHMLVALQILIVLGAIVLGARLGSIGIGFAGGLGVLLLGIAGVPVTKDDIPFDVVGIIMSVIAAISVSYTHLTLPTTPYV